MTTLRIKSSNSRHRVAILVSPATGWGRRLIHGIANFVQRHDAWDIHLLAEESTFRESWKGDGVIARIATNSLANRLNRLHMPVVNVSAIEIHGCDFPRVTTNHGATAALAASHFIERGFTRFAYVGALRHAYVARHAEAFINYTKSRNRDIASFDSTALQSVDQAVAWQSAMSRWLSALRPQTGIFCWSTGDAINVLRVCRTLGILVPDELAVLSGDDDSLTCRLSQPTLSGLVVASEQIGYQAAARLHRLMSGERDNGKTILLDPIEIHTRRSTNAMAIKDTQLQRAMRYLRDHAFEPIGIDDVADAVPMNRRSLERRCRTQLGTTPLGELHRLRLAKVRQLLSRTDLSVAQIAAHAGFTTPTYMTAVFRAKVGMTPLKYRAQVRA